MLFGDFIFLFCAIMYYYWPPRMSYFIFILLFMYFMYLLFFYVILRYQADIEARDTHSRTPLFIACAMNREGCADYLIECLDHSVHVQPTEGNDWLI